MCAWRVSAVRVFSGKNFGGQVPLRGTSLMAGTPLATPKLAYRRASRLLTPHWCHYPKRDSPNCRFLSISAPDSCIETGRTLARNALILLRQGFSPYHTLLKEAPEPHLEYWLIQLRSTVQISRRARIFEPTLNLFSPSTTLHQRMISRQHVMVRLKQ